MRPVPFRKGGSVTRPGFFLQGLLGVQVRFFNEKVMKGMILLLRDSLLLGRKRWLPMDPTCEDGITGRALNKRFDAFMDCCLVCWSFWLGS